MSGQKRRGYLRPYFCCAGSFVLTTFLPKGNRYRRNNNRWLPHRFSSVIDSSGESTADYN